MIDCAVGKYVTPTYQEIDRKGLKPDFGSIPDERSSREAIEACRRAKGGDWERSAM